jgi:uncharacterized protein YbaR (Trm112 family)
MYKRFENKNKLDKNQKITLLEEYTKYYEDIKISQGMEKLNIKIPRELFYDITDKIGTILIEKSNELSKNGAVKDFLDNNPLPENMATLLPDEFRTFCLILNALKQWVSAEQAATDKYLLGGTARATLKEAAKICIITNELLTEDAELHHPLRDGRPPILISKKGHKNIENQQGISGSENEDTIWQKMKSLKKEKHGSWELLREGCNAILDSSKKYRANAKPFANSIIRETGLNAKEIINKLDSINE